MSESYVVYSDATPRRFAIAALIGGALAMALGLLLAVLLLAPGASVAPELGFGRLQPAHVHTATFAFVANAAMAGVFYAGQRLLRAPLASPRLAAAAFWGWQIACGAAALSLILGAGDGAAGAGTEWAVDVLAFAAWLAIAWTFFQLLARRRERRLHPAAWFFIAAVVGAGAALASRLLAVPTGLLHSYPLWGGAASALAQAWEQVQIERFVVVAPVLGALYWLVPLASGRPLFSRRLAAFHFWAFVLVASISAPERLLFTAAPAWLQGIGTAAAALAWIPAAAGAACLLATMRGAGARLLRDPSLQFAAAALVCLALAGALRTVLPVLSLSIVTDYTAWNGSRSHIELLGFAGLGTAALLYALAPRLAGAPLRSPGAARAHLYLAVLGVALYAGGAALAGATQGVMLTTRDAAGGLAYAFGETARGAELGYAIRLAGGALYALGAAIMIANLAATLAARRRGGATEDSAEIAAIPSAGAAAEAGAEASVARGPGAAPRALSLVFGPPAIAALAVTALLAIAAAADFLTSITAVFLAAAAAAGGFLAAPRAAGGAGFHRALEHRARALAILVAGAVAAGIAAQAAGLRLAPADAPDEPAPRTALEIAGRDVYRSEGCASCHTQMVRPLLVEAARYGAVTAAIDPDERPALWGQRRVGPDLSRVGDRRGAAELYDALAAAPAGRGPDAMPSQRHLEDARLGEDRAARRAAAFAALAGREGAGRDEGEAAERARRQGEALAAEIEAQRGVSLHPQSEMIAVIAYLKTLRESEAGASAPEEDRE